MPVNNAPGANGGGDEEIDPAEALAKQKAAETQRLVTSLSKKNAKSLMIAAGFRPGPNVSLQLAIDTFKDEQFRQLVLYSIFLLCFTISSYTQRNVEASHYYVSSVKGALMTRPFAVVPFFKAYRNISRPLDCWLYLETVLPEYLFEEKWYNGEPIPREERANILQANRLVQAPRLRQVRVKPYKCAEGPGGLKSVLTKVPKRLRQFVINCYPAAEDAEIENEEELEGWPIGNKVRYKSGEELSSDSYSTNYEVYDGGGYAIDIPLNSSQADVKAMFRHLANVKWSDLKTRAIFMDFVMYNAPSRLFCSVRLCFEFLNYGEVVPTESFRVLRLGLIDDSQYVALFFEGIVWICVLRFIYEDAVRFLKMPKYFLRDLWNYLSLCMYAVFFMSLFFKVRFFMKSLAYVNSPPSELDSQRAVFDFESLGWTNNQTWNWTSLNSVLIWGRAFRFLKYANDSIAGISSTIFESSNRLVQFFFLFGILNAAFAVSFHISFGVDVKGHTRGVTGGLGTLPSSIFELWRMLMKGGNDLSPIVQANRLLGPMLLILYQVVIAWFVAKFPAAILIKSYSNISENGSDDVMAKEFRAVMIRNFNRFVTKCFRYGEIENLDEEIFRKEREAQYEEAFHSSKRNKKKTKGQIQQEIEDDIELVNANFEAIAKVVKFIQRDVKSVEGKVEAFCEIEMEKHEALAAKHVEPPSTLLFGRKEAWGKAGTFENKPDLSSCVPMLGNKTILPPNWKLYHNEAGDPFYFNILEETVQWDPPLVLMAGVIAEIEEDEDEAPTKKKKKKKDTEKKKR